MSQLTPAWIQTNFEMLENSLNGKRVSPIHDLRKRALSAFAAKGLPTPRDEDWKYTNVGPVFTEPRNVAALSSAVSAPEALIKKLADVTGGAALVFINGIFEPRYSSSIAENGVEVQAISEILKSESSRETRELLEKQVMASDLGDSLTALSTAFLTDGAFIRVKAGAVLEKPLHLIFLSHGDESIFTAPRVVIAAARGSQVKIIQSFAGDSRAPSIGNSLTQISVEDGARVELYKIQQESEQANHFAGIHAVQAANSFFGAHLFSFGGDVVRNEVRVKIDGTNCETVLNGLTVLGGRQHVDNHTVLDHAKPHCHSVERFKGIYAGSSHGVFCGTIVVEPDAQKTNAIQSNNSILLSTTASVDSKPQLKIWADDVKCTHGATVGQLDEEGIFYLRSRGLAYNDARNLMIRAFASDLIKEISPQNLRDYLEERLERKLEALTADTRSA